jgi:hypothetical protein
VAVVHFFSYATRYFALAASQLCHCMFSGAGETSGACPDYVIDHVVPLKRGGLDARTKRPGELLLAVTWGQSKGLLRGHTAPADDAHHKAEFMPAVLRHSEKRLSIVADTCQQILSLSSVRLRSCMPEACRVSSAQCAPQAQSVLVARGGLCQFEQSSEMEMRTCTRP